MLEYFHIVTAKYIVSGQVKFTGISIIELIKHSTGYMLNVAIALVNNYVPGLLIKADASSLLSGDLPFKELAETENSDPKIQQFEFPFGDKYLRKLMLVS